MLLEAKQNPDLKAIERKNALVTRRKITCKVEMSKEFQNPD
jgi:hypothetical protein